MASEISDYPAVVEILPAGEADRRAAEAVTAVLATLYRRALETRVLALKYAIRDLCVGLDMLEGREGPALLTRVNRRALGE